MSWRCRSTPPGGVGCISVTANVAPQAVRRIPVRLRRQRPANCARELNDRLYPLHYAMFEDASPGPCKYALSQVHDWITGELRLPLVRPNDGAKQAVDAALVHAGLV